jgi:hypothetical protein
MELDRKEDETYLFAVKHKCFPVAQQQAKNSNSKRKRRLARKRKN